MSIQNGYVPAFVYPQLSKARMAVYEALLDDHLMCSVSRLEPTAYGWMRERLPTPVFEIIDREYWRSRIDVYRYGEAKLYLPTDPYLTPPQFLLIAERDKGKFYSLCKELDPDLSGRQPNGLSPLLEKIAQKKLDPPPATIGRAWIAYLCVFLLGIPFALEALQLGGGERVAGVALITIGALWCVMHYLMVWSVRRNKLNRLNKLLWPLIAETEELKADQARHLEAHTQRVDEEVRDLLRNSRQTPPTDLDAKAQEPAAAPEEPRSEIENVLAFPAAGEKPAAA